VPDIIVQPELGVIYSNSTSKDEEHGGFSVDDTNVALVVANPGVEARVIQAAVQTTQIAPTILSVLGLDPEALQAIQQQQTLILPAFERD
jgi:arylsulfatase A-like enzyme